MKNNKHVPPVSLGLSAILIVVSLYLTFSVERPVRASQSLQKIITKTPQLKELQARLEKLKNDPFLKKPVDLVDELDIARYRIAFDKAVDYAQKHFEKKELEAVLNPFFELWRTYAVRARVQKISLVVDRLIIEKKYEEAIARAKEAQGLI